MDLVLYALVLLYMSASYCTYYIININESDFYYLDGGNVSLTGLKQLNLFMNMLGQTLTTPASGVKILTNVLIVMYILNGRIGFYMVINPKVSIIVPVFNRSHIITNTLDTINAQTYTNVEVVIVDDCSNDSESLTKVLDNYDLDIIYIRHEKNLHGGAARNTGIEASSGDYIAFLDSDDLWAPNKIELCVNYGVDKNEILYSRIIDRKKVHPKYAFDNKLNVDEYLLVERQTMQTSSLFMKADFAKRVMFDPSLKRFQDTDFIIRAQKLYSARFTLVNDVLVYMSDDDKGARISSSVDPFPAQCWLDKIKHLLTEKTISVFTFNRIINYSSNSLSRISLLRLFIKGQCYKYPFDLDYKVFIKCILGSYQSKFRR